MRKTDNVLPTPRLYRCRLRTRRTPALEEMVLDMVAQNPCRSTRGIARELGVEHRAIHLILQDKDLYPYHCSQVQGLIPHDYYHRLQYCEWLLREHEREPGFLEHILLSDEAALTRDGVFNSHNSYLWAPHNSHVTAALLVTYLLCSVLAALYASQVLFILTCVNCAFFLCTLFFCINSLVHKCHLQFLCSYSTLRVSAPVSQLHH
jgi:hypothetical protein